jgi:FkbM family methyltransferase
MAKLQINAPLELKGEVQEILAGSYACRNMHTIPFRLIYDFGANCGAFSIWAAMVWPEAEVLAFEPDPSMCSMFKANVKACGLEDRITLLEVAVGSRAGKAELHIGVNPGCSSTHVDQNDNPRLKPGAEPVTVDMIDARDLASPCFAKIDTEGAEVEIFGPLPKENLRALAYEYHSVDDGRTLARMATLAGMDLEKCMMPFPELGTAVWVKRGVLND